MSAVPEALLIAVVALSVAVAVMVRHLVRARRRFRQSEEPLIHRTTPLRDTRVSLHDDEIYPHWWE